MSEKYVSRTERKVTLQASLETVFELNVQINPHFFQLFRS